MHGLHQVQKIRAMLGVSMWRAAIGLSVILVIFTVFGWVMYRARRTHTRRIGGISIWQVLRGRFPRIRRRR